LDEFDKLSEKSYEEYLVIHEKLLDGKILKDESVSLEFHRWVNSSSYFKLQEEVRCRGWFKEYTETIDET
jgi:hypothetical protein